MTKVYYNNVYQADHPSNYGGTPQSMSERIAFLRERTNHWINSTNLSHRLDSRILEVGCGMAYLSDIHPGWHGIEYSKTAVVRVKELKGAHTRIFLANAQSLPFKDEYFHGVFAWAALEHVPDPDKAFKEIDRVLMTGGYSLIAPAWNCRSWTVKKLEDRNYVELSWAERIEKTLIPLRELFLVRALFAIPQRVLAEIKMLFGGPASLRFKRLSRRWDLIEEYGHVADDDAVADIDPHASISFFKTRGYEVLSHKTLFSRLLSRHEPVIARKSIS